MPAGSRRLCIAIDVKGYSGRSRPAQLGVQRHLVQVLVVAAAAAGVSRDRWLIQQAGDGELGLLPAGTDEFQFLPQFLAQLTSCLDALNAARTAVERIRVRIAVDQGLVHPGDNGYVGSAVVNVARMVDAAPLRAALDAHPEASVAVAVSDHLYQDLFADAGRLPAVETFQRVRAVTKDRRLSMWLYVPGYPPRRRPWHERTALAAAILGIGAIPVALLSRRLEGTLTPGVAAAYLVAAAGGAVTVLWAVRTRRHVAATLVAGLVAAAGFICATTAVGPGTLDRTSGGDQVVPAGPPQPSPSTGPPASGSPEPAASSPVPAAPAANPTTSPATRPPPVQSQLTATIECPAAPDCRTKEPAIPVQGRVSGPLPAGEALQVFVQSETGAWYPTTLVTLGSDLTWAGRAGVGPATVNRELAFRICLFASTPEFRAKIADIMRNDPQGVSNIACTWDPGRVDADSLREDLVSPLLAGTAK